MTKSQQCPVCHSSNPEDAQFCQSCGSSFAREVKFKKSFFLCNHFRVKILRILLFLCVICIGLNIAVRDPEKYWYNDEVFYVCCVFSAVFFLSFLILSYISIIHFFKDRVFYLDQSFIDKEMIKRVCYQNKYPIKERKNGDLIITFFSMARSGEWKIYLRNMNGEVPLIIGETQAVKHFISFALNKKYYFLEVE